MRRRQPGVRIPRSAAMAVALVLSVFSNGCALLQALGPLFSGLVGLGRTTSTTARKTPSSTGKKVVKTGKSRKDPRKSVGPSGVPKDGAACVGKKGVSYGMRLFALGPSGVPEDDGNKAGKGSIVGGDLVPTKVKDPVKSPVSSKKCA